MQKFLVDIVGSTLEKSTAIRMDIKYKASPGMLYILLFSTTNSLP
jgi:hypothetical protein